MKRLNIEDVPAEDSKYWEDEVSDIKRFSPQEEKPSAPLIISPPTPKICYANAYSGNKLDTLSIGDVDNIDRKTADKFKKGEFKIQRRLDLHGFTEKEAFSAVVDFVKESYIQKLRCILIVTGKGLNKETDAWYEKKGILKECVPNWLNLPELRPLILSFAYATAEDGGSGALYVLLRRHRN
ncbi:MAG: Smr/MutS family protein [Alphaproteobacteria bacterium]|nr:Smr/MutS family protein [Alphaproteobacteria bacterium]